MRNTNKCIFAFSIINTSSVSVRQSSESAHMNSHHMYTILLNYAVKHADSHELLSSQFFLHIGLYQIRLNPDVQICLIRLRCLDTHGHVKKCIMYLTNSFCCQSCDGCFRRLLYRKAKFMGIILGSFPYKHVYLRCLCLITVA